MANRKLFQSASSTPKAATTINKAGGKAFQLSDKAALAQYVMTGTLNNTYYASGKNQLNAIETYVKNITDNEFLAKLAIYARQEGYMKDTPALILAYLSNRDIELVKKVFPQVIDNFKMLRNYVQIMRSGVTGRKSLGNAPRRLIRDWLDSKNDHQLFRSKVGKDPSLADIIKMVHPKPKDASRSALYAYLLGNEYNWDDLCPLAKHYEGFKQGTRTDVPNVPFQLLDSLNLKDDDWKEIARNAGWHMSRMNINTFQRHKVFEDAEMVNLIADRLKDPEAIAKSKVFPYQLLVAYKMTDADHKISEALQDAMEIATENIPVIDGQVVICPDTSGSMTWASITGDQGYNASSSVKCIDVAALVSASFLRSNPTTRVMPFDTMIRKVKLNSRDSIMTNSKKLSSIGGGGTNCSLPLATLNKENYKADLVIYVSDNESWADRGYGRSTGVQTEWKKYKKRNPNAKLVCIDIQPYNTTQAVSDTSVLNVGGFSDRVFDVITSFYKGSTGDHWIDLIESLEL